MTIHCNVTGAERKRLAQVLGEITFTEPVYMKAPTFAYVIGDYHVDKDGTIEYSDDVAQEAVLLVAEKLKDQGFEPEIENIEPVDENDPVPADESTEDEAPADTPAEMPTVAPEAEPEAMPEDEATEANVGAEMPDVTIPEEDSSDEANQPEAESSDEAESDKNSEPAEVDNTKLTVSIPRAKLPDDALDRLRTIVANKEDLFKRALLADALPIEVTDKKISFPWFTLTGINGEAAAYTQFITAVCQMATEQKRVLDKPYDGDNDRFTMRIFMVRLGMKGTEFALARKLMMKHLSGNSGWRYEDSANKSDRRNQNRSTVQHLKRAYPNDTRVTIIPMNDQIDSDIQHGMTGAVIGVDDNGSVFIKLDNGSAFGISFGAGQLTENEENAPVPSDLPEDAATDTPLHSEPMVEPEAPTTEDELDATDPEDAEPDVEDGDEE